MSRTIQVFVICIYGLVLLFLLVVSLGFGVRIGGTMYADEGFGLLRSSAVVLGFVFLVAGPYLIWRSR